MGYIGAGITRFNTADELTVTGDAQIDTTTLVVDSTNNRVGIGTASPAANRALHVSSTAQNHARFERTGAATSHIEFQDSTTTNQPSLGGVGDNLTFRTAFTERMRIDSSGNVGIGGLPSQRLHVYGGAVQFTNTQNTYLQINTTDTHLYTAAAHPLRFGTNSTERMRLDASGNLLVGKTASGVANAGAELQSSGFTSITRDGGPPLQLNRKTSDGDIAVLKKDGTTVGSISVTTSGTTYNTTSDIRLKTDIEPIDHATDMLMAMNPVSHRWKADPDADAVVGFIAQEMQEIVPEAVSKGDSEDDMWSMDYGRITPVLVAALQDAHNKIEQLEQRIADMETK